ncbi:DsbA family protein [Halobacterium yunchengense]|uniref:DsbA family protein n=1 Tax=Halobacterium yunchengense TaxID=3108497 RepID=UPI00300AC0AA
MFDNTDTSGPVFSRRSYLKTAGTTAAGLAFAGAATADASQYDTVVDVVEAGADPTGEELVDDVLAEYNEDDTRLEFPDGRYKINKLSLYERENFAMVGTGDATLVPGPDYGSDVWIGGGFVRDIHFEGFTLDHSAPDTDPSVAFGGYDGIVVRDVTKRGYHDGPETAFGFSAWEEDGHVLVENLRVEDGSEPQTAVCIYVDTEGTVTFRDCHVEGFGNNGLYASASRGPVHVEGGVYKNNDITQIRLGSPGSYVRDATVVVDDDHLDHDNSRGIRVADGHGPVRIENCDIRMESGQGGGGVVSAYSGGGFELVDSRIYVGEDYTSVGSDGSRGAAAVLADEPTGIDDPGSTTIRNVSVTGEAAYRSAVCLRRDDVILENVCIHQTGDHRNGVLVEADAANNRIVDTNINVPDEAVVSDDGDVEVDGLRVSDACPFPAGMDRTTSDATDPSVLADAPWPDDASRRTYATMGGGDAPTADVFFGFEMEQDDQAALMALPRVLEEFVATGELNVRYRPYGLQSDRGRFLANLLQGVWDHEWPKFWSFFAWAYEHHDAYDLETYEDSADFLSAFGVRNFGLISVLALEDAYADTREQSADLAGANGIPGDIPCVLLDGEMTWFDRNDPHERDDLADWIRERL